METEKIAFRIKTTSGLSAVLVPKEGDAAVLPLRHLADFELPDYVLAGVYDAKLPNFSKRRLGQDIECARMDARAA